MIRGTEHLHNVYMCLLLLLGLFVFLTPFDNCFYINFIFFFFFFFFLLNYSTQYFPQFDIFCIIGITQIFSYLILAYKMADWPLRRIQNVDRIEYDRTSNKTDEAKNILNCNICNIRRFKLGILIIY